MQSEIEEAKQDRDIALRGLAKVRQDLEQLRALLASHIVQALDTRRLSVREAESQTGIPYADFSRIRNGKLDRFTVDKLMTILDKLDLQVTITLDVRPLPGSAAARQAALL